jgi:hypothetical protein
MEQRPDLAATLRQARALMADIEKHLAQAQELSSRARFAVAMAMELSSPESRSLDMLIKSQIYTEAMGHAFARIIEGRTHLDVGLRAVEEHGS